MTQIVETIEHLTEEVDNLVKLVEKTMQHEGIRSLTSTLTKELCDEVTLNFPLAGDMSSYTELDCMHIMSLYGFKRVQNVHSWYDII